MSDDVQKKARPRVSSNNPFAWISIAAMVIAMMHYGYSCHGCMDCRAPAAEEGAK